jgi:hypothetical protein
MSRLHPMARALIAAAKRQEGGLPPEARERVHTSVLQRAALGAAATGAAATSATTAAATSVTTATAKTGIAVLAVGHPLVAGGLALVVASGSGLAIGKIWRASLDASAPAAPEAAIPAAHLAPSVPAHVATLATPPRRPTAATPPIIPSTAPTPIVAMTAATPVAGPAASQVSAPRAAVSQPAVQPNDRALAQEPTLAAIPVPSTGVASIAPPSNEPPGVGGATDPLSLELPILRRVRAELGEHHPAQAIALLDEYASVLQSGPLGEEAELARVSALCQIGPTADARSAIQRFVARWPGSPMAVALQSGCPSEDLPTGAAGDRHGSR